MWPTSSESLALAAALTAALVAAGHLDRRTGRIPNALTLPVWAAGAAYAALHGQLLAAVSCWLVVLAWYALRFVAGGDAKLLLGLFAFFPHPALFLELAGAALLGLLLQAGPRRAARRLATAGLGLALGLPPAEADLRRRGTRAAGLIALAGLAHLWVVGPALGLGLR